MHEISQPQQEITAHLADLNETMQREKIPLSPEMKEYLKQSVEALQTKLMNGEPVYPKDMEFVEKIKKWLAMPKRHREQRQTIEQMKNPEYKLTNEQKEKLFEKLKLRFKKNSGLHNGLEWGRVEESLEINGEAMWSINEMEELGHEPDVYNWDGEGFDIGTCSRESPESGKNCVYDKQAAEELRKKEPETKFNGSAEEMAEKIRIDLMSREHYLIILKYKNYWDQKNASWLKTPSDERRLGVGFIGNRYDKQIHKVKPYIPGNNISWRGSLRVLWKKT